MQDNYLCSFGTKTADPGKTSS